MAGGEELKFIPSSKQLWKHSEEIEPVFEKILPIGDGMKIRCVVTWKTEEGR